MTAWSITDLSVSPPSFSMAHWDVESLSFDAEMAVSACVIQFRDLETDTLVTSGVTLISLASNIATVKIDGPVAQLVRGRAYELLLKFTAGSREWSRTLVVDVKA